jgi:hypothetical protein
MQKQSLIKGEKMKRILPFSFLLLLLLIACAGPAATPAVTKTGATEITVFRSPT